MSLADDYKIIKSYREKYELGNKTGCNEEKYLEYVKSLENVESYVFTDNFNIGEVITKLVEITGFNESILEYYNLDVKTFRRIKNGKIKKPQFYTVLSICVAMHLPTRISEEIIYNLGHRGVYKNPNNALYKNIIECRYDSDILDINYQLAKVRLKLL